MASVLRKIFVVGLIVVALGAIYFAVLKPTTPLIVESATETNGGMYLSSLTDQKGQTVGMDQEKLIFLNIWATWCGPCNIEMPGIQKLYDRYKDHKKVQFYIVSDEESEIVNPFIEGKGYRLPFYRFTGAYPAALDGNSIPRTYIIYKGKILIQEIGASQWDRPEISELIEKQLAEI